MYSLVGNLAGSFVGMGVIYDIRQVAEVRTAYLVPATAH